MANEKDTRRGGAPPSGADRPGARHVEHVDEDTELRIRPDEKVPDPGESNAVQVPQREWDMNNRRKDTATARAQDEPLDE